MNKQHDRWALKAHTVFPVDRPPIDGGVVTLSGHEIISVGENTSGVRPIDLGDVAILPGLVNTHTHLEFSDLRRPLGLPRMALPDWIRLVMAHRRSQSASPDDPVMMSIKAGLAESIAAGVTTLGEIATSDWPHRRQGPMPIGVTAFCELIGLSAGSRDELRRLGETFAGRADEDASHWQPGISPHAPYSIHPLSVQAAAELSRTRRIPLAMHLAETTEELQLLRDGEGPFRELLVELGIWDSAAIARGSRPLDYLKILALSHRSLVIHGNYLQDDELGWLARCADRMSLVYCPRTHEFFGHRRYRLAEAITSGVRVALGTDSRASNRDLSLFDEMRSIRRLHPEVLLEEVLKLGTISGAEALGQGDISGSLTVGKSANLAIIELPPVDDQTGPHERLFDPLSRVIATIYQGRVIHDVQGRFVPLENELSL